MFFLSGYIKSAQLGHTANGCAVCDMTFALNQRQGQGSVVREIALSAWGQTAEAVAATYKDGGYALIEASFRDDVVETATGTREHHYCLVAHRIHLGQEGLEINSVSLVGTAGLETEVKYFESGAVKATSRVALRRTKEHSDWLAVEAWGQEADVMANYVGKGKLIEVVQGYLKIDIWEDKITSARRMQPVVVIERLNLLGSKLSVDADAKLARPPQDTTAEPVQIPQSKTTLGADSAKDGKAGAKVTPL